MLHLLFESGDGNSELKGKRFPLGKNIYAHLKEILDNYKGDKSVEGYKRLVNIINMNDNEGGILYNEMKRIKNFFDNYNGSRDSVNYILNGGEPMENWVRNTLNTAIETVKGFKQAKATGGLKNSFRKEHTKDRVVKPPKETKIKMSDINKNLLNVAESGFKITKPNKVKSSVNEKRTFYITEEQISTLNKLDENDICHLNQEHIEALRDCNVNYNKYQYLLRKPINKLSLDEMIYLYSMHFIKKDPYNDLCGYYEWNFEKYLERIKKCYLEEFTAAYDYFSKLKFPIKIYRAMYSNENIDNISGKKYSLSWTVDPKIYSDEKSKFKNCNRIVEAIITPDMVQNEWTIVNFITYTAKHFIDPNNNNYGEYELTLKPRFKHEKLSNLKQFNKMNEELIKKNINSIINEELSISKDVEDISFEIFSNIKKHGFVKGEENFSFNVGDILVSCFNYYFNSREGYEKEKPQKSANSVSHRGMRFINIALCYLSGRLVSNDLYDSIFHEVEHLYQQEKTKLNFQDRKDDDFYHFVEGIMYNGETLEERTVAAGLYLSFDYELNGYLNGLYGQLKETDPQPNEVDKIVKESALYQMISHAEEALKLLSSPDGDKYTEPYTIKYNLSKKYLINRLKRTLKTTYKKIGKIIVRFKKNKLSIMRDVNLYENFWYKIR